MQQTTIKCMLLKVNQPEAKILLEALGDARVKRLGRYRTSEEVQALFCKLFDFVYQAPDRPAPSGPAKECSGKRRGRKKQLNN